MISSGVLHATLNQQYTSHIRLPNQTVVSAKAGRQHNRPQCAQKSHRLGCAATHIERKRTAVAVLLTQRQLMLRMRRQRRM